MVVGDVSHKAHTFRLNGRPLRDLKYLNINEPVLEDRPEITFTRGTQSHIDVCATFSQELEYMTVAIKYKP